MEISACLGVGCLTACSAALALGAAGGGGAAAPGRATVLETEALVARAAAIPAVARLARDGRVRALAALARPALPKRLRALGDAELVVCLAAALGAAALAGFAVTGSPVGCAGAAGALAVLAVRRARRARQAARAALCAQMPEVFQTLAVALGSGRSVPQALRYVGESASEPVGGAFSRAAFSLDCGVPLQQVLDELEGSLRAPGLDLVVPALGVSQRTGAPLKELLEEAASIVAERLDLERKLEVKTSQARMSAQVVAAMPLVMIAFLGCFSADFRAGAATPVGVGAIASALALDALAWWIIGRIMAVGM